jgi:hypothetical protein
MDCKTARLLLHFARPLSPELETSAAEGLEEHLVDCAECGALARAERKVDDHIGQAMRAVPVPEGLRERLLARAERERHAWYRRRFLAPITAVAAGLLLILWFGLGRHRPLPGANIEEWYQVQNLKGSTPAGVEKWFWETHHLQTVAPSQFNYQLLASYNLVDFQGKQVPWLQFVHGSEIAQVFILSDTQFDLSENGLGKPQGYPVEVFHSRDGHFAYVVVYPENKLDRFLVRQADAAA